MEHDEWQKKKRIAKPVLDFTFVAVQRFRSETESKREMAPVSEKGQMN